MRILIVDDNAAVRRSIRSLLAERSDWHVCDEAADGIEAIAKAKISRPEIILMDISMPRMNGLEATEIIRRELPITKVILISQNDPAFIDLQSKRVGASASIAKSALADHLIPLIDSTSSGNRSDGFAHSSDAEYSTLNTDGIKRNEAEIAIYESDLWQRCQKEAFQAAMNDLPLGVSLEILNIAAIQHLGENVRCAFYLVDASGTKLHHVTGMSEEYAECVNGFEVGPDSLACGLAVHTKKPVITSDVREDFRWEPWLWLAEQYGYRAVWSFPVETSAGRVVGTFAIYFKDPRKSTAQDQELFSLMISTAAIIISRYQESKALRESELRQRVLSERLKTLVLSRTSELKERNEELLTQTDQLRDVSSQLLQSQDEEQKRIARELHDSAGQTLAVLKMEQARIARRLVDIPDLAKNMEDIQGITESLIQEVRTVAYLLHPPLLDEIGLIPALRQYVDGLVGRSEIEISLDVSKDFVRLPAASELTIFRIIQEGLTNIHRHSKSKEAVIRVRRDKSGVRLEIEDHGVGVTAKRLAELQTNGGGLGIRGMRERLRLLQGEMKIESGPTGTKISLYIPVQST